ncbi:MULTISPECIES: CGNR zinc finger domain-containing protein [Microbacterium]|uniref:CGNR zinc finger domain-containing protein n=1 Tax=Microbacterium TaxID=33882 RepID=UPI000CCF3E40|nr:MULTISPECIES: CGNR zinc finger domain-containing protein [Microbacterium]MDZ5143867.1 CGNR zinc finger domain-containing protein [Microbacterium testaceum]PNW08771.1 RNA-binding protein [Microbacterium testaceum]REC96780.1 putative RNA-binding Zn ribbon-like protein [Microbacterium sp. AG157]WJS92291.1 CGNR zinc finger domain-containing protein [Microbacterium testaceum]
MVFIRDTELVLRAAVELVNTLPHTEVSGVDTLVDASALEAFTETHGYTGSRTRDARELTAVRGIRPRLLALWSADRDGAVPLVNAMLADGRALPQLVRHDGLDWHIHASDPADPLATRILVETALAFVDVIRADEYDRVRVCDADDCNGVYVDFSKNGSKRYCDAGNCGNRMNVNAYRKRRADAPA